MAELLIEDRGAVRTLTMNRPDKRNALNNTLTEALLEGLRAADADDAVNVIVLTGAGTSFCAGADLSEFKTLVADNQPLVARRAQLTMSLHEIFPRLTKPVVSAINGAAIGGGAGLALAADIALMAESAQLAYPEVKHGIVAAIVMPNLVRQIGRKAAFGLVATGRTIGARAHSSSGW
jgi:enoyl-CoA hydratase/carnithine racemase